MVKGQEQKTYEDSWGSLVCSAQRRGGWGLGLMAACRSSWGMQRDSAELCSHMTVTVPKGGMTRSCIGEGQVKVRERFFTEGVVGYWNRIPREAVTAPTWRSSRTVWTVLLEIWFDFWVILCQDLDSIPSNFRYDTMILWFCDQIWKCLYLEDVLTRHWLMLKYCFT